MITVYPPSVAELVERVQTTLEWERWYRERQHIQEDRRRKMRGDISHRGRKGNFLPGEKEESWKTAIREKEVAKQKQKEVATA